jgi:multidrug resistance efflux pump
MSTAAQLAKIPVPTGPEPSKHNPGFFEGRISTRSLKIAAGLTLLLVGGYGIFSEQQYIASSNAVVTAYVVSVRTPIEGTVTGLAATVGTQVSEHTVIGHVDNPRVDQQHFQNLRDIAEQARSSTDAVLAERDALEAQRQGLLARAGAHIQAVSTRLHLQTDEAAGLLAAKQAALEQATLELNRGRQLHDDRIISDADLEKLEAQYQVASHEAAASQADLATVRAEAEAASQGVLSEPGINDVAYSRQRADEISLRLAEIDRTLVALRSQVSQATKDVESEAHRAHLIREADLVAPGEGVVWKLEAMNGEHVGVGDSVVQVVDCSQSFVLAEVPQERVPEIAIGGVARFKLSGESAERAGVVLSVSGDQQKGENQNLAAFPNQSTETQRATVRIGLRSAAAPGDCIVGRTARVLLPTNGSNRLARWYRRYF